MSHFNSYTEYLSHWMFRALRKTAFEKTNGQCEICGKKATQIHHRKYPKPWGTFDVPSNLQPVCHACHCELEGIPK